LKLFDDKSFQLISNWYCTAIREMVRLDEFFEDPNWISKKLHFKATPTEVSRAIDLLIQTDLLKRDSKGIPFTVNLVACYHSRSTGQGGHGGGI